MREYRIESVMQIYEMTELSEADRELVEAAKHATNGSYSPYSRFSVGAALRLQNGIVFTGANQENAAFPSGLCAERTAFSSTARMGGLSRMASVLCCRSVLSMKI